MQSRRNFIEQLAALLRNLLAGEVSRNHVKAYTRQMWSSASKQVAPFAGHGSAGAVFDSLWNIEDHHGDDYLLRVVDFEYYLRWLEEGVPFEPKPCIAIMKGTVSQFARLLDRPAVRVWVDGLGWHELVYFASPYTGRAFTGEGPLEPRSAEPCVDVHTDSKLSVDLLNDVFDTLGIDTEDLYQPPSLPFSSWKLWRQDDNGVQAIVSVFTGRVKAQRALAKFETLPHRQMYWLQASEEAG